MALHYTHKMYYQPFRNRIVSSARTKLNDMYGLKLIRTHKKGKIILLWAQNICNPFLLLHIITFRIVFVFGKGYLLWWFLVVFTVAFTVAFLFLFEKWFFHLSLTVVTTLLGTGKKKHKINKCKPLSDNEKKAKAHRFRNLKIPLRRGHANVKSQR